MIARNRSRAFGVVVRRALEGLDETDQRSKRGAQFMAGVGDEVDPQALDPPRLGLIAQRDQGRHDFAVFGRERRDADVKQPFDRHPFAPLHGLGFAARHHPTARVDDIGGAQAKHERIADPEPGQKLQGRLVGRRGALVRADNDRGLRHRAHKLRRKRRSHEVGEHLSVGAWHRVAR